MIFLQMTLGRIKLIAHFILKLGLVDLVLAAAEYTSTLTNPVLY